MEELRQEILELWDFAKEKAENAQIGFEKGFSKCKITHLRSFRKNSRELANSLKLISNKLLELEKLKNV